MKDISSFFDFFNDFKAGPFMFAVIAATLALWFNSNYVGKELYEKDKQIILLKIDNLEVEAQSLKWAISNIQSDTANILPLVERMENLVSRLITSDGEIVITKNMVEIEREITSIKKDIEYLKARIISSL